MKKIIAVTAIISGILLIVVPRYVLPACEFEGFRRMHCSDTAEAEMITGVLFALVGVVTLMVKWSRAAMTGAIVSAGLSVVSFSLPDRMGYCHSSTMPCNYGMVPAIRFIAVLTGLIMIVALARMLMSIRKKGSA